MKKKCNSRYYIYDVTQSVHDGLQLIYIANNYQTIIELQLFVYAKVIRGIKEDGDNSIIAVH